MPDSPTTQLVEAILIDRYGLDSGSDHTQLPPSSHEHKEAAKAILLAIADAVDAQIGEGLPGADDNFNYWRRVRNAEKARMRTFTAALRKPGRTNNGISEGN